MRRRYRLAPAGVPYRPLECAARDRPCDFEQIRPSAGSRELHHLQELLVIGPILGLDSPGGPRIRGCTRFPRRAAGGGRRAAAGYCAAFFLRAAQEAFIRSDTASFSSAVIGRRFLAGVASDAVSATGVAAAAGRRAEERRAAGFAGAEVPRILSTSFNALISACRRSISLCRAAIAFAITLTGFFPGLYRQPLDAPGAAERVHGCGF